MRIAFIIGFFALAGCEGDGLSTRARADFNIVADAVIPVAERLCRRAHALTRCDFRVVIDDRPGQPPNAFQTLAVDGQPVLTFTTAMIALTRNADEQAFVIAHEAAHHLAGHLGQQVRRTDGRPVSNALLARAIAAANDDKIDADRFGLVGVGTNAGRRAFEFEADAIGTRIAALAGFDPVRAAAIFHRLGSQAPHRAGSYPSAADRYRAVLDIAADVPVGLE